MPFFSLPDESFCEIFSYLDNQSLYNCLFINRYLCIFSISILWKKPFNDDLYKPKASSVITTLLSCLNEDEISSLIPYKINFNNRFRSPLFEYGKFVRKINHAYCVENIMSWLKSKRNRNDSRIQKLISVIYHAIIRQGSNLRQLRFKGYYQSYKYIDLPKFSIFTTDNPGIKNLEYLYMNLSGATNTELPNILEFLSKVSTYCRNIVKFDLSTTVLNNNFAEKLSDIIKVQPLKIVKICSYKICNFKDIENIKKIVNSLKFRSETLKELSFLNIDFQGIDLSFIPKLKFLECLEFTNCNGFTHQFCNILSKKKFHLKKLMLINGTFCVRSDKPDVLNAMVCSLVDESLRELSLSDVTLETIQVIKESCPNISSLHLRFFSAELQESKIIQHICTFPSLKILNIEVDHQAGSLAKVLGDYLPRSVEYLNLDFYTDLDSFKYFTYNCKADLKRLLIRTENIGFILDDFLSSVDEYKKVHNSLKMLGVDEEKCGWTQSQSNTILSIRKKGVDVVSIRESIGCFYYCDNI